MGAKRIPLPACAYDAIRGEFMTDEDTTDYTGYEDDEDWMYIICNILIIFCEYVYTSPFLYMFVNKKLF